MNEQMKEQKEETKGQTIGRKNARELTPEEVELVSGGRMPSHGSAGTCCGCGYDDVCY